MSNMTASDLYLAFPWLVSCRAKQKAVTAYLKSKQLLLFAFANFGSTCVIFGRVTTVDIIHFASEEI